MFPDRRHLSFFNFIELADAPSDKSARRSPLSPLHPEPEAEAEAAEDPPVWWDDIEEHWRTRFAPPPDFDGDEDGDYGDDDYSRTLTPDEEDAVEARHRAECAQLHAAGAPEREAWFAALAGDCDDPGDADRQGATATEPISAGDDRASDPTADELTERAPRATAGTDTAPPGEARRTGCVAFGIPAALAGASDTPSRNVTPRVSF